MNSLNLIKKKFLTPHYQGKAEWVGGGGGQRGVGFFKIKFKPSDRLTIKIKIWIKFFVFINIPANYT